MKLPIATGIFFIGCMPCALYAMQDSATPTTPENAAKIELINELWGQTYKGSRLTPDEIQHITSALNLIKNDLQHNQAERARVKMSVFAAVMRNVQWNRAGELTNQVDNILMEIDPIPVPEIEFQPASSNRLSIEDVPQEDIPIQSHELRQPSWHSIHHKIIIAGVLVASVIGYLTWRLWPSHAPEEPEHS